MERMMRDAKITQLYEGTQQIQRLVIACKRADVPRGQRAEATIRPETMPDEEAQCGSSS